MAGAGEEGVVHIDDQSAPTSADIHPERREAVSAPAPNDPAAIEARLEEIAAMVRRAKALSDAAAPLAEAATNTVAVSTPAPEAAPSRGVPRLGQMLVERELITPDELDEALQLQQTTGRRIGETLVEIGAVSGIEVALVLAEHLGVPFVDLRTQPPDPALAHLIPQEIALRYTALPVARWNEQLVIAMANPNDVFAVDDLRVVIGQPIIAALTDTEQLRTAIGRAYQHSDVATSLDDVTSDLAEADEPVIVVDDAGDGPMVQLVKALLEQASRDRASDLHV